MKSMLCLTVYEAKGLEFDDVILFNFFAMGEIRSAQWKLLQHVSEMEDVRDMVPDWILNIDEAERERFISEAVSEAMAKYQHEKASKKSKDKESEEKEADDAAVDASDKEEAELVEKVTAEKSQEYRQMKQ